MSCMCVVYALWQRSIWTSKPSSRQMHYPSALEPCYSRNSPWHSYCQWLRSMTPTERRYMYAQNGKGSLSLHMGMWIAVRLPCWTLFSQTDHKPYAPVRVYTAFQNSLQLHNHPHIWQWADHSWRTVTSFSVHSISGRPISSVRNHM